ncbi:c-type cytochrome biogenesis protein CcmF [Leminorella grimontii]|uniref:C-type cytochrome biogenesis protein CcmF n=1 Tax=Leminorella grimontii TaxID=82981 RepID=A0AAV5MXN3_9GAMM|nr:heme lyase CcmF/NrfE family subunit [Leminorella grimontii]KFC96366.1 cytochrome c heme lyase subunit [Leminorella grimontii ATCC 33999 = DSM 5078]GKX54445.1 c-type cytochrome biogenesis protein CcmF [Leminorella grimontii]
MIPETGHFFLALSLALAALLSVYPLIGAYRQHQQIMNTARPLSYALFASTMISFLCLVYSLINNDFSVVYVANNSNSELPVYYRIAAAWGAHEGSLLLWVVLLSSWTLAVALFSRRMPLEAVARVLSVMGMINVGFLLFVTLTSNPFERLLPFFPIDGHDLNPLLQDVGLIFHPPLLYMGYVGFSVAFAFAIASLMSGRLDTAWARWSRPWTLAAWIFLTLGIVLGSFWAYYELGWGGWWFWDPVENASLMPWISGTALLHSLAVTEKRGTFKAWTVLLAIVSFSLCLLGTFLVRSGILVSVHAFASDPTRGMFILGFLVLVIGGSLLLYAFKGGQVNKSRVRYDLFSRETMLLANNILLTAAMLVVLLGTLLPLVHKQLGLGSISIGEPFFNTMFVWIMAPFALLLGVGPLVRWRRDSLSPLTKRLMIGGLLTVGISWGLLLTESRFSVIAFIGLMMAIWVATLSCFAFYERITYRHSFWQGARRLSAGQWGMFLAHMGLAVTVIGIAFSQNYSIERDVRMKPGDSVALEGYSFKLVDVKLIDGPNYTADVGTLVVTKGDGQVATLTPEKRYYATTKMVMTEAAIDAGIGRDLYGALGENLGDGQWSVRLYYKPFMRWIWFGGLFMALGGILCMLDARYRPLKAAKREVVAS